MPMYCKKCPACAHAFDAYSSMAESDRIKCPQCGGATETDFDRQGVPAASYPVLLGREGWLPEYGFNRKEVAKARRTFTGEARECIRDDGSVHAPNTKAAGEFITQWHKRHAAKVEREATATNQ